MRRFGPQTGSGGRRPLEQLEKGLMKSIIFLSDWGLVTAGCRLEEEVAGLPELHTARLQDKPRLVNKV